MIKLTESANSEIKRLIETEDLPEGSFLRVGVASGGCSGFSYKLSFDSSLAEDDIVTETDGVKVVCDPQSHSFLDGAEIHYHNGLHGRGFLFNNPNAASTCSCGDSFGC